MDMVHHCVCNGAGRRSDIQIRKPVPRVEDPWPAEELSSEEESVHFLS